MDEESFGKGWYLIIGPSGRYLGRNVYEEENDDEDGRIQVSRMVLNPAYTVVMETMLARLPTGKVATEKLMLVTTLGNFLDPVRVTIDLHGASIIKVQDLAPGDRRELLGLLKDTDESLIAQRAERAGIALPTTAKRP
jgi:hypothetical protein